MTLKSITLLALACMAILAVLFYLFRKVRFKKDCPVCGNMYTDRIARPNWMRIVPSKAYQCNACRHRYYYIGRKYEPSTPTMMM